MDPFGVMAVLAIMLFTKHFIADGPLQTRYHIINKGKLFHPGGLAHAGIHAGLTMVCLLVWAFAFNVEQVSAAFMVGIAIVEFVVHYFIDYGKCQLDAAHGWSSVGDDVYLKIHDARFFYAFLADQTLHSLTYVAVLYFIGAWSFAL